MTAFRFPLLKVLEWRRTQLELAELKFKQQAAALADLDRQRTALEASGAQAERDVRAQNGIVGSDLAALGGFRLHIRAQQKELAARRTEYQRKLAAQQHVVLEANRRCRLLERLQERRRAEWEAARDRELEEMASESYLAQWNRRERA
ncbi:MAG TPA: hypothetical protein VG675_21775 [Bryobacteraceae bacterium]|nr:hypothetical protein [Bryobacteraceae bacterium]